MSIQFGVASERKAATPSDRLDGLGGPRIKGVGLRLAAGGGSKARLSQSAGRSGRRPDYTGGPCTSAGRESRRTNRRTASTPYLRRFPRGDVLLAWTFSSRDGRTSRSTTGGLIVAGHGQFDIGRSTKAPWRGGLGLGTTILGDSPANGSRPTRTRAQGQVMKRDRAGAAACSTPPDIMVDGSLCRRRLRDRPDAVGSGSGRNQLESTMWEGCRSRAQPRRRSRKATSSRSDAVQRVPGVSKVRLRSSPELIRGHTHGPLSAQWIGDGNAP